MAKSCPSPRPAWQTGDLEDEWVDQEDLTDAASDDGSVALSLTEPLTTHIKTLDCTDFQTQATPSGTFLVRQDVQAAPIFPRSPAWNKKNIMKDFFSPLSLQRMFEPPSPPIDPLASTHLTARAPPASTLQIHTPAVHGRPSNHAAGGPELVDLFGDGSINASRFTFSVPRTTPPSMPPPLALGSRPQAHSTPGPAYSPHPAHAADPANSAPNTDTRLRLFRFQYDTFTREHLSALVDSIAPFNTTPSAGSMTSAVARHRPRASEEGTGFSSDLRSTKRVKLSPASGSYGQGDGDGATVARPKPPKDYVQESIHLMQQIKQARDVSKSWTAASSQTRTTPGLSTVPDSEDDLDQKYPGS